MTPIEKFARHLHEGTIMKLFDLSFPKRGSIFESRDMRLLRSLLSDEYSIDCRPLLSTFPESCVNYQCTINPSVVSIFRGNSNILGNQILSIYAREDEYFYVQDERDQKWYECDQFQSVMDLLEMFGITGLSWRSIPKLRT